MEHWLEFTFWSLKQQNKIPKNGAKRCVYKRRGCCNGSMNLNYVGMWTIHKLTTTKDEGCKAHTNKGYTLPKWDTMQELMVLVHLKMNIWEVEGLEVCKAWRLTPNSCDYF